MEPKPIDILRLLDVGREVNLYDFDGDVLDYYVAANKAGLRIRITKQDKTLIIRRVA